MSEPNSGPMSDKIEDGGPAFPMGYHRDGNSADHGGMTLRDWFAGQALAGWSQAHDRIASNMHSSYDHEEIVRVAYKIADAMLARKAGAR
jgi:hypothetical protein